MREFKYYLSSDPGSPSPPTSELLRIEADSASAMVTQLGAEDRLREEHEPVWVHVLVWASADGQLRGFKSTRTNAVPSEHSASKGSAVLSISGNDSAYRERCSAL
jgi:hypothetical protein